MFNFRMCWLGICEYIWKAYILYSIRNWNLCYIFRLVHYTSPTTFIYFMLKKLLFLRDVKRFYDKNILIDETCMSVKSIAILLKVKKRVECIQVEKKPNWIVLFLKFVHLFNNNALYTFQRYVSKLVWWMMNHIGESI